MSQRLRVIHVSGCLDVGGQEKLLVEFARHADRDRFDLHFVSLAGRGPIADELEALGWPVTTLDLNAGLHVRLPVRLARLFAQLRSDIVHTHNDRPLLYAAPAARLARIAQVIHTKHGRGVANSRRQNLLIALATRLVDRFVCVSDDCARLATENGVRRVTTIHNGIDVERFANDGPRLDGPAVIVARLCADKDIHTLLDAVAIVCRTMPTFRLQIAGAGPCEKALKQHAAQLGLCEGTDGGTTASPRSPALPRKGGGGQYVDFLGVVRDVPALLRQARSCVLSSISEGVPLTLLEAMASGLPVVATRVGGVPEIVRDGVTGMLVPPRSPAELATALLRVHQDDDLARRLGAAGQRLVRERFDVRDMVEQYERLYLESHPRPTRIIAADSPWRMQPCALRI